MDNLIKFRIWDGKDKKMMPSPASIIFTNDNQWRWFVIDSSEIRVPGSYDKQSAVMLFTGLCDKNGKEMCTGDIITIEREAKYLDSRVKNIGIIKFGLYSYKTLMCEVSTVGFYISTMDNQYWDCNFNGQCEVIGDIFNGVSEEIGAYPVILPR